MLSLATWLRRRTAAAAVPAAAATGAAAAIAVARDSGKDDRADERDRRGEDRDRRDDARQEDAIREERAAARQERRDAADDEPRRRDRQQESSDADAGDGEPDDGDSLDAAQDAAVTPTPDPAAIPNPNNPTAPIAPGQTWQPSIQTADGGVIAGWDPATRSMVATSGNVSASVGPNGPLIIIDEEAVVPVQPGQPVPPPAQPSQPVPAPTPVPPDGGQPDGGFVS